MLGILFTVLTGGFKLTEGELPKDHFWLRVVLIGVLIGFYEGFFGPGAGTFFLIALHVFLKIGMVQSSGTAKAFNIAANFAAFLTFASGAAVCYEIAIPCAIASMLGNRVGAYYAIKIGGKKLYELARKGQEVERKPRNITIFELAVEDGSGSDWDLRVRCSKGTYVRTLCHDIGQALGCGGCMSALRRTMAAGFTLAESRSIEDVQAQGEALLSPTDSLFRQYPAYHIAGERDHRRCLCGNPLAAEGLQPGLYRVYSPDGAFLCLSRWEAGVLTSEKNFFGA